MITGGDVMKVANATVKAIDNVCGFVGGVYALVDDNSSNDLAGFLEMLKSPAIPLSFVLAIYVFADPEVLLRLERKIEQYRGIMINWVVVKMEKIIARWKKNESEERNEHNDETQGSSRSDWEAENEGFGGEMYTTVDEELVMEEA